MAREEAELRRRTELAEVEERKNTHIQVQENERDSLLQHRLELQATRSDGQLPGLCKTLHVGSRCLFSAKFQGGADTALGCQHNLSSTAHGSNMRCGGVVTARHEQHNVQDLTKRHEAAFAEIKAYYNDVTANNLDLVKALKEDAAELRKREAAADKLLAEVAAENRALSEPLAQARCRRSKKLSSKFFAAARPWKHWLRAQAAGTGRRQGSPLYEQPV